MENNSFCKLSVPTFKQYDQLQGVILYCIDVQVIGVTGWRLELRYSDLFDLDTILRAQFQRLPKFPGKTLSKLTTTIQFEKRRVKLNFYLSSISERLDIVTCPVFCELFEIMKYAPKYVFEQPKIINSQQHNQTIKNCQYIPELEQLFIVSCQTEGYKQLMAYMQNNQNQIVEALGLVELFSLKDNQMIKRWQECFVNQAQCLHYSDGALIVGLEKGKIIVYQLDSDLNAPLHTSSYQMHKMRVNGVYYNKLKKVIYSISQDGTFVITYRDYLKHKDQLLLKGELTCLLVCEHRQISFIGNSKGSVFILDINKENVQYIRRVDCQASSKIVDLAINNNQGFLFAASEIGQLQVIDIGQFGREINSKAKVTIQTNQKTKKISYCQQRHHLYIGDTIGNVTVISEQTGCPIYSLSAHGLDVMITLVYYLQDTNKLITYGKDQILKFWEFPTWIDLNEIKRQEYQEIRQEYLTQQQIKQKTLKTDKYQDDDEDDLNDWHKNNK
ncbi:unnamed protein product [Paramecium sonneborni]|uniref:PX domain-containing protein n=1 Tax=Paramecium sonneborni TaxID=65129 RepID=A0A8S1Q301_9CILI|nr:unnamed protein product [Paramecium sonneborni]